MANIALVAPATLSPPDLTSHETSIVRRALKILEAKVLKRHDVISCQRDFENYLRLRFAGLVHEQAHAVYLDTQLRVIDADVLDVGTQSATTFNVRHLVYRSLMLGANSVVLAHNHPCGNPLPSDADLRCLDQVEHALGQLRIQLNDSLVITPVEVTSLKAYRQAREEADLRARVEIADQIRAQRAANRAATLAAKRAAKNQGVAA